LKRVKNLFDSPLNTSVKNFDWIISVSYKIQPKYSDAMVSDIYVFMLCNPEKIAEPLLLYENAPV
jgi:hypothetical protein